MAFYEGLLYGLAMIAFIGPVFFLLLKSTLDYGPKMGIAVALGIISSDVICVGLCLLGAKPFLEDENNQIYIALAGGLILLGMGLKYLIKPSMPKTDDVQVNGKDILAFYTKGLAINLLNPFVFVVWILIIGKAETAYDNNIDVYTFLLAVLIGIFGTDLLKVLLAQKIKPFIKEKYLLTIYRFFGLVMLIFAIRLLWFFTKSLL